MVSPDSRRLLEMLPEPAGREGRGKSKSLHHALRFSNSDVRTKTGYVGEQSPPPHWNHAHCRADADDPETDLSAPPCRTEHSNCERLSSFCYSPPQCPRRDGWSITRNHQSPMSGVADIPVLLCRGLENETGFSSSAHCHLRWTMPTGSTSSNKQAVQRSSFASG